MLGARLELIFRLRRRRYAGAARSCHSVCKTRRWARSASGVSGGRLISSHDMRVDCRGARTCCFARGRQFGRELEHALAAGHCGRGFAVSTGARHWRNLLAAGSARSSKQVVSLPEPRGRLARGGAQAAGGVNQGQVGVGLFVRRRFTSGAVFLF